MPEASLQATLNVYGSVELSHLLKVTYLTQSMVFGVCHGLLEFLIPRKFEKFASLAFRLLPDLGSKIVNTKVSTFGRGQMACTIPFSNSTLSQFL